STTTSRPAPGRTTSSKKKKAVVNPDAMSTSDAARILRAMEISNPSAAYSVTINTRISKSSLLLRGRVSLPTDARKAPEVIVVFADPDSPSATVARAAGAQYVGGADLFPLILNGTITPTKCLSTPGMLPEVSKALARYLGPRGLMPVAKRGGVGEGEELGERIREAGGAMDWKADKLGVVRAPVARMDFDLPAVENNVKAMIQTVREASIKNAQTDNLTASKGKRGKSRTLVQ
ncbi:hypothetical protein TREMEDRAFT_29470, partial [Tremella mesenterica DSM 1558]|uniref:uncharacterized protein n=1 Tax=Tremella mesenterica (strain ATCC 24925 / CBS 8224 / DSM 1558 / NBRC 9311 / NRRL Y-6157 / RJB 2259-6 / UBC 559-6) TaxID=578456 RepID=UPI0003F49401